MEAGRRIRKKDYYLVGRDRKSVHKVGIMIQWIVEHERGDRDASFVNDAKLNNAAAVADQYQVLAPLCIATNYHVAISVQPVPLL